MTETSTTTTAATRPHVHWQPSRRALATRSLTAAMRLTGDAKRAALTAHFAEYATTRLSCSVDHPGPL
jgi:hypothetical protein